MKNQRQAKSKKIFLLYSVIVLGFLIFLLSVLSTILKSRHIPSLYAQDNTRAKRGDIISADGFRIATTEKLYKAIVNTRYIDPDKKELFVELFHIYSGIDKATIESRLQKRRGVVVLSYNIKEKMHNI